MLLGGVFGNIRIGFVNLSFFFLEEVGRGSFGLPSWLSSAICEEAFVSDSS